MKRLRRGCHWCGLSVKTQHVGARIGRPGRVGPGRKCSADPTTEPLRGKKHIHRTQDDTNMLDQGLIPPTGDLGGDEKQPPLFNHRQTVARVFWSRSDSLVHGLRRRHQHPRIGRLPPKTRARPLPDRCLRGTGICCILRGDDCCILRGHDCWILRGNVSRSHTVLQRKT